MPNSLRRNTPLRAAVGVVAAYAIALQMLLGGFVATQMAAAGLNGLPICHDSDGGGAAPKKSDAPVDRVSCAICQLLSIAPPLPEAAHAVAVRPLVTAAYLDTAFTNPVPRDEHNPQTARGPPANA